MPRSALLATTVPSVHARSASSADAADAPVGFAQIGSESGWRAAETSVTKSEARTRKITLEVADAQQKQREALRLARRTRESGGAGRRAGTAPSHPALAS